MRDKAYMLWVALAIALTAGVTVWAVVALHQWTKACHDAGGKVEERWEYADVQLVNSYDAKGNLVSVTPVVTQHYSYHCWVNGVEVQV